MTDNNNSAEQNGGGLEAEQSRLLQLIVEQGILHDSEQQPIVARDGETHLSWVMNFLAISLNAEGLQLATRQMLRLLETFEGRQLATIGTAAVPLLSACVLESGGKYNGLMVRSQRKAYGTASVIDGRINDAEPVIVIDDSIGSGHSMFDCIAKLEQAGLRVEGCACLVRFGYDSGYAKLVERGYRVVALFDNMADIAAYHPHDWQYDPYPLKSRFDHITWDEQRVADHLSPFQVVRQSMQHYWETGRLLQPPRHFNEPLDTGGGVWLSLRMQDALYTSLGRHGFWHFPGEDAASVPFEMSARPGLLDISRVAWLFAAELQHNSQREQLLQQGAFALSLLGELEVCHPGDVDRRQHGLVLRSTESPWKMGGALPNMPGISSDAHLLHHARFHNAGLFVQEPCQLFRHTVRKLVEPGAEWPYGGAGQDDLPWDENAELISPLAAVLLECVCRWHQQGVWPEAIQPQYIAPECQWLFLSVYLQGQQLACMGTSLQGEDDLLTLVQSAAQDERWLAAKLRDDHPGESVPYIRLSLLSQAQYLGFTDHFGSLSGFVPGQDTLAIQREQQFALLLPEVVLEQQLDAVQLTHALYQKAGINEPDQPVNWHRYRSVTWHADAMGCQRLAPEAPLPVPDSEATPEALMAACLGFVNRQRQENWVINSTYQPFLHQASQPDALFNTAYVLWLIEADAQAGSEWQVCYRYLEQGLAGDNVSGLEQSYCVLALLAQLERVPTCRAIIAQQLPGLEARFNRHGQLTRQLPEPVRSHYGIELYALLQALKQGFYSDENLLVKVVYHLVQDVEFRITPCQYPLLLQTLALAKTLAEQGSLALSLTKLQVAIDSLVQALMQWQQSDGAFLPETPALSPVVFSAEAMNALFDAGYVSKDSLQAVLNYLQRHMIQPGQQHYFPIPEYAVGGLYSGLLRGSLTVPASALFYRLLKRVGAKHNEQLRKYTADRGIGRSAQSEPVSA